jgi:hypothetical protein
MKENCVSFDINANSSCMFSIDVYPLLLHGPYKKEAELVWLGRSGS